MKSEETRNLQLLIIVLVIVGVFSLIYNFFIKEEEIENNDDKPVVLVVNDHNRFFTVSSCVSKYIGYLSINDTDNLLVLLSNEYKDKNNINYNNIYDYIGSVDDDMSFSPIKMYEEKLGNYMYKYYIYGSLKNEHLNNNSNNMDYYIVVILDEDNMTFAVEPYDGELFK